jgi:hypothetical protein
MNFAHVNRILCTGKTSWLVVPFAPFGMMIATWPVSATILVVTSAAIYYSQPSFHNTKSCLEDHHTDDEEQSNRKIYWRALGFSFVYIYLFMLFLTLMYKFYGCPSTLPITDAILNMGDFISLPVAEENIQVT